ncbi:hypothetical protein LTS08_005149 [Lithohypha guttulata]|nr:hypothetical protein LTS08_005149 [Lithohypha guttulata]
MAKSRKDRPSKWSGTPIHLPNHLSRWPDVKVRSTSKSQPTPSSEPKRAINHTASDVAVHEASTKSGEQNIVPRDSHEKCPNKGTPQKISSSTSDDKSQAPNSDTTKYDSAKQSSVNPMSSTDMVKQANEEIKPDHTGSKPDKFAGHSIRRTPLLPRDKSGNGKPATKNEAGTTPQVSPTPVYLSSTAKARLKDAVASHKRTTKNAREPRTKNVFNARSISNSESATPAAETVRPDGKPADSVLPQVTSQELVNRQGPKLRKERSDAPPPASSPGQDSRPKQSALQPADAVMIPVPQQASVVTPSDKFTQKDRQASFDRIARTYGERLATDHLKIRPHQTFSSNVSDPGRDTESDQEVEKDKSRPTRQSESNKKPSKSSSSKRKSKKNSKQQGNWDVVLAEARKQADLLDDIERQRDYRLESKPPGCDNDESCVEPNDQDESSCEAGAINQHASNSEEGGTTPYQKAKKRKRASQDSGATPNQTTTGTLKKQKITSALSKREANSADKTKQVKARKDNPHEPERNVDGDRACNHTRLPDQDTNSSSYTQKKGFTDRSDVDVALLTSLKPLIPQTIINTTLQTLAAAETLKITNIIERKQRSEMKKMTKGKLTTAVWQDVDAEMAIEHGLIDDAKTYHADDPVVVIKSAAELISKLSQNSVVGVAIDDEPQERDKSGRRDANNMSEMELQLSLTVMQKQHDIERLEKEVRKLKAQVQKS